MNNEDNLKKLPFNNITSEKAESIGNLLIQYNFIHAIESVKDGKRTFISSDFQEFSENVEFACDYDIPFVFFYYNEIVL